MTSAQQITEAERLLNGPVTVWDHRVGNYQASSLVLETSLDTATVTILENGIEVEHHDIAHPNPYQFAMDLKRKYDGRLLIETRRARSVIRRPRGQPDVGAQQRLKPSNVRMVRGIVRIKRDVA